MTLLHMDGFDLNDSAIRGYASATGQVVTSASTRFGYGSAIDCSNGFQTKKLFTAAATVITGVACFINPVSPSTTALIQFYGDSGATEHVRITIGTDGSVVAGRAATPFTGGSLAAGTVPNNGWHYIEIKVTISDTVGVVEMRLDGSATPFLNLTGLDTKNAGTNVSCDAIGLNRSSAAARFDDWYICDTAGSAPNNTFLGDVRVVTLAPNGNGNYSQFVGSDGNSTDNYLLVDESPAGAYATADYVGSATSGNRDSYLMTDLPAGVTTVFGTNEIAVAAKSDAGAQTFKQSVRVASTDYDTAALTLATTYQSFTNLRETNPNTGVAWTVAGVNGVEVGVKAVT